MLNLYRKEIEKRSTLTNHPIPPQPLSEELTREIIKLLETGGEDPAFLLMLLRERVEPGVSGSAKIKAEWLRKVALGETICTVIPRELAITMLGEMGGGCNVEVLTELLEVPELAPFSGEALKGLTKIYEAFERIAELSKKIPSALETIESWAKAEWFTKSKPLPVEISLALYKVDGEINTDDFSPGNEAQSRADIPLHASFFGKTRFPDGIDTITSLRLAGKQVAFAGDVVGTGSSRKSAINSLLWHIGDDIPGVPNKRSGGVVFGETIAPIFYATARDAGVLPIECPMENLQTGDTVILNLEKWTLTKTADNTPVPLSPAPVTLLDEFRAGGRLNLIIGKQLTRTACDFLGVPFPKIFQEVEQPQPAANQPYTLAQKIIGRACGTPGVLPGTVCQPKMTTVASQDTTGPMTMQEITELACLRFKTDLFMQSFCHTAAYPKAGDFDRWKIMRETTVACGGVTLYPGDGVIHSWVNKMILPDTVGTGGDSHTRFPLGISFPAGSGLVAFAAALGFMPLEMPQSILVRFHGQRLPGITVRDMVNAIPLAAVKEGLLTVSKKGKKNLFAGTIIEIEGVDDLSVEEAFELSDSSAERSAAACTLKLPVATVAKKVRENADFLKTLVADGYEDKEALQRRIAAMETWLEKPELLQADGNAQYLAELDIDLGEIREPLLACPNDPDDVKPLSAVAGVKIDEAFVGSCMTHLSHLQRARKLLEGGPYAEARLWIAPSTRMDRDAIRAEGGLAVFAGVGGRVETPGCSLCMGNQARVHPGATVISTSTRNFDNRLGNKSQVYLGSTELTTFAAVLGRLPQPEEYFDFLRQHELIE